MVKRTYSFMPQGKQGPVELLIVPVFRAQKYHNKGKLGTLLACNRG